MKLGSGGFGRVFQARDGNGRQGAMKFIPKAPGAERELLFNEALSTSQLRNVVPILDKGETESELVLVMPLAQESLESLISSGGRNPMEPHVALPILIDIANALVELDGKVVHRDIKPANVLLIDGDWCLADFGISRYAEVATAGDTRKFSWTPPYAAPEQWNHIRVTSATDVYAFGVLAYELLTGQLPFIGPDFAAFREQHLNIVPTPLSVGTTRLQSIVEQCLLKDPAARPRPGELLPRLQRAISSAYRPSSSPLASVNLEITRTHARQQADSEAQRQRLERVNRLLVDSNRAFTRFSQELRHTLEEDAPLATFEPSDRSNSFIARLGNSRLSVSGPIRASDWQGPFSVTSQAQISVLTDARDVWGWRGRSHSLWFCDAFEEDRFAWYEMAFMDSPFTHSRRNVVPFASSPREVEIAFQNVIGGVQIAWGVNELDRDDPSEFVDRWIGWFAAAVSGRLYEPSTLPERRDEKRWRER